MTSDISWRPQVSIKTIKQRATLLQQIRDFMECREILEVDTPLISHYANSDPYVESMSTRNVTAQGSPLYLQTSPEFCMKRLLAADLGSIYQIAHVFRDEDSGKKHNSEFSMLEWYHLEFDYFQLMDELAELIQVLGLSKPSKMTYAEAFMQALDIDPHTAELNQLQDIGGKYGWGSESTDRHALLDYIFSEGVITKVNKDVQPLIIYDYPACMAALATLKSESPHIAERFELFINGMEIANGFNELCDFEEQRQRFDMELKARKDKGLAEYAIDINFLAALDEGLPKCSGIAVGIDRLLMVLSGKDDIKEVIAFTLDNN